MKLIYENNILVKIIPSKENQWKQDTISHLKIDWEYLEERYTAFQVKVWKEIAKVKWNETRTYKDIAISISSPNAYRAVANACGANPLPLLIPCHRIVSKTGTGGYSFGRELKKSLLEKEGV